MHTKRIHPVTTSRARSLRSNMTDVERLLWRAIRGMQMNACRFRRQHPIGPYIADFACIEQRIVVEPDGGQHQDQRVQDDQRTAYLQAQGWHVLRFWNNEVLENLDGVLSTIAEHLSDAPHPSLPPFRGKELYAFPSPFQGEGEGGV
jgi:very-short-patch-repair endonuclease